jgi:hypothetical protein
MCGGENTFNGDAEMGNVEDEAGYGEIHYVSEGSNLLMGGDGDAIANAIDAETNRVHAVRELEEVRLETMRFQAEREDVSFQRMSDALDEIRRSSANPFADLLSGFPGFGSFSSTDRPDAD